VGIGAYLVSIAVGIIAVVIAWNVADFLSNYIDGWGAIVGVLVLLFEFAGIAYWRGWY
jgi:hypothetical protein